MEMFPMEILPMETKGKTQVMKIKGKGQVIEKKEKDKQ